MKFFLWFRIVLCAGCILVVSGCSTTELNTGYVPSSGLKDGVYEGSAVNGPVKVVVSVMIEDQMIRNITLAQHRTWRGGEAGEIIPIRILKKQSTDVDVVSGATMSSVAIMNAVQDAVNKSRGMETPDNEQ
jgi:uncharacterized protein with FMN-binding domain